MHISEGVLSAPVLVTGALLTTAGTAIGLKRMTYERIPEVAVLSAAFFVASLIHVPIGPSSVHLILNGLVGILLGWMSFPSTLIALALQAVLFQFGGFTVLGVNTFNVAAPAVMVYYLFRPLIRRDNQLITAVVGFLSGMLPVGITAIFVALSLVSTGEVFLTAAKAVVITHLPVMLIEGIITAFCIVFLKKVKPEILEGSR
ncbi:MAG: cobalt transporter CbiM [Deltaproteobacteria bacterium]